MTYPVDDNGNVRVDFVWGHMPMQPNQQREGRNTGNKVTDGNWTISPEVGSDNLYTGYDFVTRNTGDGWQNEINRDRPELLDYGYHDIANTGWSNYPAFLPDYAGDGDAALEFIIPDIRKLDATEAAAAISALGVYFNSTTTHIGATTLNDGQWKSQDVPTGAALSVGDTVNAVYYAAPIVPNVVGLTESAATTALTNAHLVKGAVTTANNAAGATALNDGKIKTQTPAAGATYNTGGSVALVKYAYTVTANNNIAGFSQNSLPGHVALTGNNVYMYLYGRTTKPTAGSTITVAGNANTTLNQNYSVTLVEDNDSYNTGGTIVTLTGLTQAVVNPGANVTIGTWITV